jgi:hypothetical protein
LGIQACGRSGPGQAGKIQCGIFAWWGIVEYQTSAWHSARSFDTPQNGSIALTQNERIATHWSHIMNVSAKPLVMKLYRAYLRSRLERYTRDLQAIAEQRENDFQAERILHQAVVSVRSKLHSL